MGCVASRLEEEEEVVAICRERKRLLKQAVERRHALAEAHCRYFQSLYAVAAAIKLFVARHSSPASPYLITFPSPCRKPLEIEQKNVIDNPMFLQQTPCEFTTHETSVDCGDHGSCLSLSSSSDSSDEEMADVKAGEMEGGGYGYYYMQMPPPLQSPSRDFGWDFFYPFESMRPEFMSGYGRSCDDDLRAVREQEGIPELEEEGAEDERGRDWKEEEERMVANAVENREGGEECRDDVVNVVVGAGYTNQGGDADQKGLSVGSPEIGRELLEALKDVMNHFIRACDSGKDVSRMLEANSVYLQSGLDEIKENSVKLIHALPWQWSTSSKLSSCKSLVASSSKTSSTWTEFKNDLFDEYGGMDSGSHSLTLGRLYAWEKKLYEEVKAGDSTRKLYEKKCLRMRNQDVRGEDDDSLDKTRAAVKDLHARILVAIRSAESISKRIEKLRDEELQPQIMELLKGLTQTWKIILECHETQSKILFEVKSFACPSLGKFSNGSHRLATLQLEAELHNWRACFTEYIASQKAYVESLHGWLTKFLVPEVEFHSRRRGSASPLFRAHGPPLLMVCQNWLSSMERLPDKAVSYALKSFSQDVRALWCQQGEEQQQKRKVDSLAKDLDRRTLAVERVESRFLDIKLIEYNPDHDAEPLNGKREQLDYLRKKLDSEKEKHMNFVKETQRITLIGFQTGFAAIFESLSEFSKASQNMYNNLVGNNDEAKEEENRTSIEGSQQANDTVNRRQELT